APWSGSIRGAGTPCAQGSWPWAPPLRRAPEKQWIRCGFRSRVLGSSSSKTPPERRARKRENAKKRRQNKTNKNKERKRDRKCPRKRPNAPPRRRAASLAEPKKRAKPERSPGWKRRLCFCVARLQHEGSHDLEFAPLRRRLERNVRI